MKKHRIEQYYIMPNGQIAEHDQLVNDYLFIRNNAFRTFSDYMSFFQPVPISHWDVVRMLSNRDFAMCMKMCREAKERRFS